MIPLALALLIALIACAGAPPIAGAVDLESLRHGWPDPGELAETRGEAVVFPSRSPFALVHLAPGAGHAGDHQAVGHLFMPETASPVAPAPAVVILHGAGGVKSARELTYARQLQAMGVAVLVVDAFRSRRERATSFTERLLEITETMIMADAYGALRLLDADPRVDARRVVLLGFSYGGMAAIFAVYAQVVERLAPDGIRFAGHAAFYAPCIARFERPATTGAPVLMVMGARDEIIDLARCREIRADLERGGSRVEMVVYPDAYHQWDGGFGSWRAPRGLAGCRLEVEADGDIRDRRTLIPMTGPLTRRVILGLCSDRNGYLIARDEQIRARSNSVLGRFLADMFGPADPSGARASGGRPAGRPVAP